MKALIAVAAAVLALAVGFLVASLVIDGDATSVGPVPSAATDTEGTTEVAPTATQEETTTGTETEPSADTVTYQVWFVNDEGLFVTYRTDPPHSASEPPRSTRCSRAPTPSRTATGSAPRSRKERSSSGSRSPTASPPST